MIFGIGTDLVDVERVAEKMEKKEGFRELVFSAHEIAHCETMGHKYEHYAARFAAKEAFLKALEIYNDREGKPELRLLDTTANTIAGLNLGKISVSLSHVKTMACAMVIIETI